MATQARAAEDGAGDHGDEGNLRAAGDEGGGHDGHAAVALVLNGAGGHDARHAAAHADQHGDEGLAGQAELAEDAVQHEGDTGHVAAGLQEGQQEEQHQHLGHEAQHRADAGHDAVQDQALEPVRGVRLVQGAFHQRRDAGHPGAVGGGIGRADVGLVAFLGAQVFLDGSRQVRLAGARVLFGLQGLFVLGDVGDAGVLRHLGQQGVQGAFRILLAELRAILGRKGLDDLVRVAVALGRRLVLGGAFAEQVIAVAEQAVIGPVRGGGADRHHGDPVDQEHDQREDRQAQPAVGDHLVDLVRGAQAARVVLAVAGLDDLRDVDVALVGDDALRVVVQLLFRRGDVRLDVLHGFRGIFSCSSTLSSRSNTLMAYQRCCSSGMSCTTASSMWARACSTGPEKVCCGTVFPCPSPPRWPPPPPP